MTRTQHRKIFKAWQDCMAAEAMCRKAAFGSQEKWRAAVNEAAIVWKAFDSIRLSLSGAKP